MRRQPPSASSQGMDASKHVRPRPVRWTRALAFVAGAGLSVVATAAPPAASQARAADAVEAKGFLDAGKQAFKAKDYPRAAGLFQKAFAKDSSLTIALYNQAFALKKANQLAQARDVYEAYTLVNPTDPDGFYGLADVYRLLGNEAEAMKAFGEYLKKENRPGKDNFIAFARDYVGTTKAKATTDDKAPLGFQAREAKKSADALYLAANKELEAGKYSAAAASFATVYELDPRRHEALLKLALALRKDNQLSEAAEAYKKYMTAQPGDFDGLFGLAETTRQLNRPRDAAELFTKYVAREERASRKKYVAYANQQIAALNASTASTEDAPATVAPAISPQKAKALENARAFFQAKDFAAAASAYGIAYRFDENDVEPLHKKALSLRKAGDFGAARATYETLLAKDRDDLDAVFGLGETLRLEGNDARAKKVFTTYLAKERRRERASYVAYAKKQLSDATETPATAAAEEASPAAVAEAPATPVDAKKAQRLLASGQQAYVAKRYDDAAKDFRAARVADPSLDEALAKEALALRKAERFDEAREAYRELQRRTPDDLDVLFGLAETERLANNSSAALKLFRRYLLKEGRAERESYVKYANGVVTKLTAEVANGEGDAKALVDKGNTFYRAKEFSAAADAFRRAADLDPSDSSIAHREALALRKAGRLDEAIAAYDALLGADETDLDAQFGRAESLRLRGDNQRAQVEFRAYLDRESRADRASYVAYATEKLAALESAENAAKTGASSTVDDGLGTLAAKPKNPPSVAAPSERHASLLGRSMAAAALIERAQGEYDAGNYDDATQYVALALARAPRNPRAHFLRGQLFDVVGDDTAARESYTRVLELAAGTPVGDLAEKRLNGAVATRTPAPAPSRGKRERPLTQLDIAKVNAAIDAGREAANRGAPQEAIDTLEEGVRTDPKNGTAWLLLGDAYLAKDDDMGAAQAVGAYQRAAFLNPDAAAPLWGLARAYEAQNERRKSADFYARYAKSDANDVDEAKQERAAMIAQGVDFKRPWVRR